MDNKAKYRIAIIAFFSVSILGLFLTNVFPGVLQNDTAEQPETLVNSTGQEYSGISSQPVNNNTNVQTPYGISVSGSMELLSFHELDNRSQTIVIGTITEIFPSKWNTDDGKRRGVTIDDIGENDTMYTDIIVSVESYLKNPLDQEEVRVRIEGGEDGLVTMTIDSEPSFYKGEKVLVYLCEDTYPYFKDIGPEHFIVTGYSQGKFSLTDDGIAVRAYKDPLELDELKTAIMNGDYSKFDMETTDEEIGWA